jgi:hypothetical protein
MKYTMEERLPFPTTPVVGSNGQPYEVYDIPDDQKEKVLRDLTPFATVECMDKRMIDIHCDKEFVMSEFLVIWERGKNWLVSPYYGTSGGTIIDWIPVREDNSERIE